MSLYIDFERKTTDGQTMPAYAMSDAINGNVRWDFDEDIKELTVRLMFESKGKGTPQREVAGEVTEEKLSGGGTFPFTFAAPDWPWSFSGKLISLVWMVSATASPSGEEVEQPIIISPSLSEIDLYAYSVDGESLGHKWRRSQRVSILRHKRKRR